MKEGNEIGINVVLMTSCVTASYGAIIKAKREL